MRYLPLAGFIALSLVWGSEWMLAASLPPQPPLLSLALRYLLAAVILLPWALHGRVWRAPWRALAHTAVTGICILCLPQILIVLGGQRLAPTIFLVALAAVPVLLAVSGKGAITTAVCGLAGVLFLSNEGISVSLRQAPWLLCPLAAAAALTWGLTMAEDGLLRRSIAGSLFMQCVVTAVLLGVGSWLRKEQQFSWSASAAIGLAVNAFVVVACGYLLFYWLIHKLGIARISTLQWTQTLVATVGSAVLLRLRPGWQSVVGGLLIVIALIRAFSNRDDEQGVILQITRG